MGGRNCGYSARCSVHGVLILVHEPVGDCAASHTVRGRTGMPCVSCWSFSLVGVGSSERGWPSLVSWLLLIRAG